MAGLLVAAGCCGLSAVGATEDGSDDGAAIARALAGPAWTRQQRAARVAQAFDVALPDLPRYLATQPPALTRLVLRTGAAFVGFAGPAGEAILDVARDVTDVLPGTFFFLPDLVVVECRELRSSQRRLGGSGCVAVSRHRLTLAPGLATQGPAAMRLAYAEGLAWFLDRQSALRAEERFRAINGWHRGWFGLGAFRPQNRRYARECLATPSAALQGEWTIEDALCDAVARFYADPSQRATHPLEYLYVRDRLNHGQDVQVPWPGPVAAPLNTLCLRWQDGLGFTHTLELANAPTLPGGRQDLEWLAEQYSQVEFAWASPGVRFGSGCGHVMLVLRARQTVDTSQPLPDLTVTPAAQVLGQRSTCRGLFGGYPSYYVVRVLSDQLEDYQLQDRQVELYRFSDKLSPEQRQRLVVGTLFYMQRYQGAYRFLEENCVSLLLDLLRLALAPEDSARLDGVLDRRVPRLLLGQLQQDGWVEPEPHRTWPGKGAVLARRLARLELPAAPRQHLEHYLRARGRAVRLADQDDARTDSALLALANDLLALPEGEPGAVPMPADYFQLALAKDLEILVKRHADTTFFAWIVGRTEAEMRAEAGSSGQETGDALTRALELEQRFNRRAREFLAYAESRHRPGAEVEAKWDQAGIEPSRRDIADYVFAASHEFRAARVALAEQFFGRAFPNRDRHLRLVAALGPLRDRSSGTAGAPGADRDVPAPAGLNALAP